MILNLSHLDIEFILRAVARELHAPIKDNEKWRQQAPTVFFKVASLKIWEKEH